MRVASHAWQALDSTQLEFKPSVGWGSHSGCLACLTASLTAPGSGRSHPQPVLLLFSPVYPTASEAAAAGGGN